jgi:hypothetical protein
MGDAMKPDLERLAGSNGPQHRPMKIGKIALELLDGVQAPRINALSMASSGIHADSDLHVYVSAMHSGTRGRSN